MVKFNGTSDVRSKTVKSYFSIIIRNKKSQNNHTLDRERNNTVVMKKIYIATTESNDWR